MGGRLGRSYQNRPSNIVLPQAVNLSAQTIKTYKNALESATAVEDPNRLELLQVYNSILFDNHLASIVETRVLKVLRSKFKFVDANSKENPELLSLFEKPWFEDFLKHAMWSKFKGTSVIELWDLNLEMELDAVSLIPRENCNFIKGFFTKEVGDDKGVQYKEGAYKPYYIQVGHDRDLGLLKDVAPAAISKKFAIASWLELVEKFGIPPRYVTTDSYSTTRAQELANMMAQMVSSHYAVLQGNEQLQVLNGINGDPHEVFDKLIIRLNSEKTKRVLGHDSAAGNTDAKGTYGSMKMLQEVAEDRHQSDKTFIKYLINKELLPRLLLISPVYSSLANYRFEWDDFKDLSTQDLIDAVQKLSVSGYITDPQHITEKTGIPIIGIKQETTQRQEGEKKKPNLKAYHYSLNAYYKNPTVINATADSFSKLVFDQFARSIYYDKNTVKTPFKLCFETAEHLTEALNKKLKIKASISVEGAFYAHLQNNIFVFSIAKTFAQYQELSSLLTDKDGKNTSWNEFKKEADKIHQNYNINYLKTEHRTAGRTALMAGKWQQFKKLEDTHDLMFVTAGDAKVRNDHSKLQGVVKPVNSDFWDSYYPPLDYNCRCSIRQVARGTESSNNIPQKEYPKPDKHFKFNAGKQKLIFSNGHPYINLLEKSKKRELRAVEDYGMPSIERIYASGKNVSREIVELKNRKQALDWFTQNQQKYNVPIGTIIQTISLEKKVFKQLLKNDKNTWKFIDQLPNVLTKANEVYLVNYKGKTPVLKFIKYYENYKLSAHVRLDNDFTITSLKQIKDIAAERSGYLLKK